MQPPHTVARGCSSPTQLHGGAAPRRHQIEPQLRREEVELGAQRAAQRAAVARLVRANRACAADERRAVQGLSEELQERRGGGRLEALELAARGAVERAEPRVAEQQRQQCEGEDARHGGEDAHDAEQAEELAEGALEAVGHVLVDLLRVAREAVEHAPRRVGVEPRLPPAKHHGVELPVQRLGGRKGGGGRNGIGALGRPPRRSERP